jgi:hypothetical protein
MLDTCDCPECIEWNAPLCQLCYLTRCEVKTFPEYEKYCYNCVPQDEKTLVFILGNKRTRITTTIENIRNYPNSVFTFILEDDSKIIKENRQVFEVPLDPMFPTEIERALQGHEVIVEKNNEYLEEELEFFTGERKVETLFVSEGVCSCGNRKKIKNSKCKECHENFLIENASLCQNCKENKVGWDKARKRYFRFCIKCKKQKVCNMCKTNKTSWDNKKKDYYDICNLCYEFEKKKLNSNSIKEVICIECSVHWNQTIRHVIDQHVV